MRELWLASSFTILALGACGGVNNEPPGVDAPTGDEDTTPPTVVSISPEDAAIQIMDVPVVIEFSEPMDKPSVAAEFPGARLVWNAAGTRVEVTIDFPFTTAAKPFTVRLPTTVTDSAGNGLAETFSATFVLAELHAVTLLHDAALSGNRAVGCAAGTFVLAGDQANTDPACPSQITFGGISWPLATLPARGEVLAVRRAVMRTQVVSVRGEPNATVGAILVDHVIMATRNDLTAPVIKTLAAATLLPAGGIGVGNAVELDVAALLDKSWLDGDVNFQLRIRPTNASDADAVDDMVLLRRSADENDGIVASGLVEPDEANKMRLELEFFQ